jgi:hypothetical protein
MRVGNLLFLSGHGPYNDRKIKMAGKVGRDLTVEEGYEVARNVGLYCQATDEDAIGGLNKVKRVAKLLGMDHCTEDFKDQPKVINGCSDILDEVFREIGSIPVRR